MFCVKYWVVRVESLLSQPIVKILLLYMSMQSHAISHIKNEQWEEFLVYIGVLVYARGIRRNSSSETEIEPIHAHLTVKSRNRTGEASASKRRVLTRNQTNEATWSLSA